MAKAQSDRKSTSSGVTKIVIFGTATGLIAWLPLVWLDAIPRRPTETVTHPQAEMAATLTTGSELSHHQSEYAVKVFDNAANSPDHSLLTPQAPLETPPHAAKHADEKDSQAAAPRRFKRQQAKTIHPLKNSQATSKPHQPEKLNTVLRVGEEGKLSTGEVVAARVELREPERVAVANYQAPATVVDDETSTIRLMNELNDSDESVAENAARELSALGFSEVHLQLARQLTSPDPIKRARLATVLPGVADIDARLWLTWLLRDDVADVRLAALSVLATTGDPDTLRRVVEIIRQDHDPRVRQQLNQIEKMRRGAP